MKIQLSILSVLLISLSFASAHAQGNADNDSVYNPKPRSGRNSKPPEIPKELKEKLGVTEVEKNEYKEITKASKIKIGKVWNYPCEVKKGVVDANDVDCNLQRESMGATNLSFQAGSAGKAFAGINTINGEILAYSFGDLRQMLVDLGEVDLTQINKETAEVKTLGSVPVYDEKDAFNSKDVEQGIEYKNLKIADRYLLLQNHTYLLRSMQRRSYRAGEMRTIWRIESVYAFRVVKFENNIVTIIWKEVQSK